MKTYMLRKEDVKRQCYLVNVEGKTLGRVATQIASILSGKAKPDFTPHVDSGDIVVAINAAKVKITGVAKMHEKVYDRYSGFPGGYRSETLESLFARKPEEVLKFAVKGMLPKNKFQKDMISRLKAYPSEKHPHKAQQPVEVKVK